MATILTGRNSKVAIGDDTIAELGTFSLTMDAPFIETEPFGSTVTSIAGVGIMSAGGSFSGSYVEGDTAGQDVVKSKFLTSSGISNFRIYVDTNTYWTSDTASDSAATCYFSNFQIGSSSNEVVSISFDFKFSKDVHEVTV